MIYQKEQWLAKCTVKLVREGEEEEEEKKKDAEENGGGGRFGVSKENVYSPIGVWYGAVKEPGEEEEEREKEREREREREEEKRREQKVHAGKR